MQAICGHFAFHNLLRSQKATMFIHSIRITYIHGLSRVNPTPELYVHVLYLTIKDRASLVHIFFLWDPKMLAHRHLWSFGHSLSMLTGFCVISYFLAIALLSTLLFSSAVACYFVSVVWVFSLRFSPGVRSLSETRCWLMYRILYLHV